MASQSRPSVQSPALATSRPVEMPIPSHTSTDSQTAHASIKKTTKQTPTSPSKGLASESELLEQYEAAEAIHKEKEVGLKKWSRQTRHTLYHVLLCTAVLLPLVPSIVLLAFLRRHPYFGGRFFSLVKNNRSTTQVIVSILVAILAYLNIFVIANFLRACEIRLGDNPVFKLLLATFEDKGDGNDEENPDSNGILGELKRIWKSEHKFRLVFVGGLCFALLSVPHLVWVGALTPIDAQQDLPPTKSIYAPDFNDATSSNWSNNNKRSQQDCTQNFAGSLFYNGCAATTLSGNLFSSMSTAAYLPFTDTSSSSVHSKQDLSGFSFIGRSYGVGSAVGLSSNTKGHYAPDLVGFIYQEPGYYTTVSCQYNATSNFTLSQVQASQRDGAIPGIFQAQGRFPNSDWTSSQIDESYAVVADKIDNVMAWGVKSTDREHVLAIAAGSTYSIYDRIQCEIKFSPANFNVTALVEEDTNLIEVDLIPGSVGEPGSDGAFDSSQGLANTAANQLAILSQLQSSPYDSDLGQALEANRVSFLFANFGADANFTALGEDSGNTLRAVEEAVAAALDDILGYVAGSQYFFDHAPGTANASRILEAAPTVQKIQLGDDPYIYLAMLGTGLLVLAIVSKEVFLAIVDRETFRQRKPEEKKKQGENQGAAAAIIPMMTVDKSAAGASGGATTAVVTYDAGAGAGSATARHAFSNV